MIVAGIDSGAKNTKTVILKDRAIIGRGMTSTRFNHPNDFMLALDAAYKDAGISETDVENFGVTGLAQEVMAGSIVVKDIMAMAKAANYYFPNSRSVIDVGAEEGRAAKIDERGEVVDFAINEQCAAGAGTFIEVMARALEIPLEKMGPLALQSDRKIPMNAQCTVFAESEVVGLIHARTSKADISKAIHDAMASRIATLIRRIGINEDVVMLGGVGRNPAFIVAVKRELQLAGIYIPDQPEYGAAVGAAILVAETT